MGSQRSLEETGDEPDKFACCEWIEANDGTPLLAACPSWLLGSALDQNRSTRSSHTSSPSCASLAERSQSLFEVAACSASANRHPAAPLSNPSRLVDECLR